MSGQRLRGLSCPARDCGHLNTASRHRSLSQCHLRERIFDQKVYSSGSAASILAGCESVWLFPFPQTQIPCQSSPFWNCVPKPKKVVTEQLRALLHGAFQHATGSWSNVSDGVWLPKGTILNGIMLIYRQMLNKKKCSTSLITFLTHHVFFESVTGCHECSLEWFSSSSPSKLHNVFPW